MVGDVVFPDRVINSNSLEYIGVEVAEVVQFAPLEFFVDADRYEARRILIAVHYNIVATATGQQLDIDDR